MSVWRALRGVKFHPRRTFLWRYALCVAMTWGLTSLVVWSLGRDAPPVLVALFPAPLWATLGAIYVEDHYRRERHEVR